MWFLIEENTDFVAPTPLIDQMYLGCTQRESVAKESDVKIK